MLLLLVGAFAFSGGAELYDCTAVCSVTGSTYLASYFTAAGCSGISPQSLSASLNASGSVTSGEYLQCQQSGSACSNWDEVEFNASITYSDQSGDDYTCRVSFGQQLMPPDGESYNALEGEICSALRPAETSLLSDIPEDLR